MLTGYDLIVVMEIGHKEALCTEFPEVCRRIFLLSEIVDRIAYDIPDPAKVVEDTDEIVDELYNLIQRGYSEICMLADEMSKG